MYDKIHYKLKNKNKTNNEKKDSPGVNDLGDARDKVEQLRVTQGLETEQKKNRCFQ